MCWSCRPRYPIDKVTGSCKIVSVGEMSLVWSYLQNVHELGWNVWPTTQHYQNISNDQNYGNGFIL